MLPAVPLQWRLQHLTKPLQEHRLRPRLKHYLTSSCILAIPLAMPGTDVSVMSGYDSRGSTVTCDFLVKNLTIPAAVDAAQTTAAVHAMGIIECTEQLRISGNRQLSVAH